MITPNTAPNRLATAFIVLLLLSLAFCASPAPAADAQAPQVLLEDNFTGPLSPEWFWGLGTWTAKDGVLRGFESGPRRHGPVKMRKLSIRDAVVNCEFRLEGKATFAGIIFNGSQERGHIVHVVMGRDKVRILAHPTKGKTVPLLQEANALAAGAWHSVRIEFKGPAITATMFILVMRTPDRSRVGGDWEHIPCLSMSVGAGGCAMAHIFPHENGLGV